MSSRPSSHVLGDVAVAKLIELISEAGWTYERISQDYGEDLIVRIFDNNNPTGKYFFIQSKGVSDISKYRNANGFFRYPVKQEHISRWIVQRYTVILIIFDQATDRLYWQCIQQYIGRHRIDSTPKKSILFDPDKQVDQSGLLHIATISEFMCNELEQTIDSTSMLIKALKSEFGMKVDLQPAGILILPNGVFRPAEDGGVKMIAFGRVAEHIQRIVEERNCSADEALFEIIANFKALIESLTTRGTMKHQRSDGSVIDIKSIKEYFEFMATR